MREKTQCRQYCSYKLQNLEHIEQFLEEKAKEGWIVYKHFGGWFSFKREKPQNIKYYVEVFEKEKWNNSYQNVVNQAFIKECEKKGWKFVDADSHFQILCCSNPNAKRPSILKSDKVTSIYKSCFMEYRYLFLCLLLMSVFNVIISFTGIVKMLSSFSQLLYVTAWVVMSAYLVGYVVSQRRWYQKALSTSDKEIPENPRHRYLYIALIAAIILLFLSIIGFFVESRTYSAGKAFTRCIVLLCLVSLCFVALIVRDHKKLWKAGVATGIMVILVSIGIFGIANKCSSIFEQVHRTKEYGVQTIYEDSLPITLESLDIKTKEELTYTTYHEVYGQFLIKEEYYSEGPADPSKYKEPSFFYTVYRTNQSYLYDQVITEECFAKNKKEAYEQIKGDIYPAKSIYKKRLDTGYYEYIFEFEKQVIKMNINVELSNDQLQKIHAL